MALAEWLTLKLSGEGYRVWCDRVQLLGGESYPKDIEHALHERTFRMLSLISSASKEKDNPLKERTLALNIGRKRKQEFVVPLNVDGLHGEELPWPLADLTYIPFHPSWAAGLTQLLKKLASIDAPREFTAGRDSVRQYMLERGRLSGRPERLWTNLLPITEIPSSVLRITLTEPLPSGVATSWLHRSESDRVVWALEGPPIEVGIDEVTQVEWLESEHEAERRTARDMVTAILREGLRQHCLAKGLHESADGHYLYFPADLAPANRLRFTSYYGDKTWVNAVGERSAWTGAGTEKFRYHLALQFRPALQRYSGPVIQVRNRVYLTDLSGVPLEGVKLTRRRKLLCKDWWNHEWLSRLLASTAWLANENNEIALTTRSTRRTVISASPLTLEAPDGINEAEKDVPLALDEDTPLDEVNVPPWLADANDGSDSDA